MRFVGFYLFVYLIWRYCIIFVQVTTLKLWLASWSSLIRFWESWERTSENRCVSECVYMWGNLNWTCLINIEVFLYYLGERNVSRQERYSGVPDVWWVANIKPTWQNLWAVFRLQNTVDSPVRSATCTYTVELRKSDNRSWQLDVWHHCTSGIITNNINRFILLYKLFITCDWRVSENTTVQKFKVSKTF